MRDASSKTEQLFHRKILVGFQHCLPLQIDTWSSVPTCRRSASICEMRWQARGPQQAGTTPSNHLFQRLGVDIWTPAHPHATTLLQRKGACHLPVIHAVHWRCRLKEHSEVEVELAPLPRVHPQRPLQLLARA